MSEDNYYAPPEAEVGEEPERKPGVVLMAMAILLTLLLGLIGFSRTASIGGIAMGVGGAIGSLLPAMLVVGLFQLGRRFVTPAPGGASMPGPNSFSSWVS